MAVTARSKEAKGSISVKHLNSKENPVTSLMYCLCNIKSESTNCLKGEITLMKILEIKKIPPKCLIFNYYLMMFRKKWLQKKKNLFFLQP